MENARILVIGAGVNGSIIAAELHNAGIDVTLLARGKRLDDLQAGGIVIENPFNQKRTLARVPVISSLNPQDAYDFILVIVRKNQVAELLPVLAQNCSPNIVFMGNNLSGPGDFIKALGQERVMMGAVYGAGKRDGSLIRAITAKSVAAPFGEVDGTITPRLKQLTGVLRQAGFKAEASTQIVDFQTTHAVGVALIGTLTMQHGGDTYALGRASADLKLFVLGRGEAHQALHALGRRIVPKSEVLLGKLPVFLQVVGMRFLLGSKFGEVGLGYHVSQAPDEVQQLAQELRELVDQAGLPAPVIRKILKE